MAENKREAIEKSNADLYRVALIGFRLRDMNGTELLTALRETTPRMAKLSYVTERYRVCELTRKRLLCKTSRPRGSAYQNQKPDSKAKRGNLR